MAAELRYDDMYVMQNIDSLAENLRLNTANSIIALYVNDITGIKDPVKRINKMSLIISDKSFTDDKRLDRIKKIMNDYAIEKLVLVSRTIDSNIYAIAKELHVKDITFI